MGFEFGEVHAFKEKVESMSRELNTLHLRAAKRIGELAVRKVKEKTPVDTNQLRNAWRYEVIQVGNTYMVYVINVTEYASFVESGHRIVVRVKSSSGGYVKKTVGWVEGRFMLKLTEQEIESLIPILWDEEIAREMRRIFGN